MKTTFKLFTIIGLIICFGCTEEQIDDYFDNLPNCTNVGWEEICWTIVDDVTDKPIEGAHATLYAKFSLGVDGSFHIGNRLDMIQKFLNATAPTTASTSHGHVMCCKTAAFLQLGIDIHEVLFVPLLVRVAENKVEGALVLLDQFVSIGQAGIHVVA